MKNIYRVTRPTWATKDKTETVLIFAASFILAIYAAWGEPLANIVLLPVNLTPEQIHHAWPFIDLLVVTLGCLLLIWIYKKLRIGCYPSVFLYCFNLPEASNPTGKSQVVGFCQLKPEMASGEIIATGASYFWENGFLGQRAGFTSTLVRGTQENNETICHILFDINPEDRPKRLYRHGVLQFRLDSDRIVKASTDAYAGYLKSSRTDIELQDIGIRAKGYAEWHSKGQALEKDIESALKESGDLLFAKLNSMLGATPAPNLWRTSDHMPSLKANFWKHDIPSPQSVILEEQLQPFINKYLGVVLSLFGMDEMGIKKFQTFAIQTAKKELDDTLVAYERELKTGLICKRVHHREDEALNRRASVIYKEIEPFLTGDTLLDIGCGNGLISSLAKKHFKQTKLLDVVEYVPKALGLNFTLYTEGKPLPIQIPYDTVLLLTVLHHASNPVELLKLAWEATNQRLIIIESVVGIHSLKPNIRYDLLDLSDENQIAFAAFVDWFYNRVLHDDVPVPYNFTTIERWQSIFLQHNMRLSKMEYLGQDIEIGPEYHVLFVLEKS